MSDAFAIYQHPSDNIAALVTPTVTTGVEDADYPAPHLVDGQLGLPAKLTGLQGAWTWDFGTARRIDVVALGNHNLTAGLSVKLQGNATASWTTPTLDAAITIPAATAAGVRPHPFRDLTGVTGYSTGGFRYWRLAVLADNGAAVSIGDVWLGALKRTLTTNYQVPFDVEEDFGVIEHLTELGVPLVYDLGRLVRRWRGDWRVDDTSLAELRAWFHALKRSAKTGLWIPDPDVNDTWWVRARVPLAVTTLYPGLHDCSLDLGAEPALAEG